MGNAMKKYLIVLIICLCAATAGAWSINDYTDEEKAKLAGIETGAEVNAPLVSQEVAEAGTSITEYSWSPLRIFQAISAWVSANLGEMSTVDDAPDDGFYYSRKDGAWEIAPSSGDVTGPASAVNNNFASFDGITGKLIKDSGSKASDFEAAGAVSEHESTYDHTSFVTGTPWADMGYLTEESDPDFTLWLSTFDSFETGDETDPVFGAWLIATPPLYSESDPAVGTHESTYDHTLIATALQAESDPDFNAWDKSTGISITESQISDFGSYLTAESDPAVGTHESTYDHTLIATALQAEDDPDFDAWLLATPPLYPGGWYDALQNTIKLSDFDDDLSYLTAETDPDFAAWLLATPPLYSEVDGSTTNEINTVTGDDSNTTSGLAITIAGGGDVTTSVSGDTVTISCTDTNTTYTASNFDIKDLTDSTSLRSTWSGKQDALTFGIANTNAVKIDSADAASGEYAKLTANGIASESASEVKVGLSLDNVPNLKQKLDATTAPVATNDTTEGYAVGSKWIDVTADKAYFCLDATEDAAVWQEVGAGGYTNLTSFVNQTAWRLFYSNADGDVTELALGTDGQVLTSTGASTAPQFEDAGAASVTYASASEINTGTETAKAVNPDALKDSVYGLDRTVQSVTASDGTGTPNVITLNLNSGHIILLTMDEDSEIAFSNVPSGYCRVIIRFIQDGGGNEPWVNQDDFLWPNGVKMDLSTAAGAKDDFQFYTFDGGTTWNVVMIGAEVQ